MNLVAVCFVDVFDLVASLPRRLPLFRKADDAVRELHLRRPRPNTTEDAGDFVWLQRPQHPEMHKWTELRNMVTQVKTVAVQMAKPPKPQFEEGRVYLEQLGPGKTMPWADPLVGAYAERLVRLHLPLRTGPDAALFSGPECFRPATGQLVIINHRLPTSAANFGMWPRVHLIIDLMRKEAEDGISRRSEHDPALASEV